MYHYIFCGKLFFVEIITTMNYMKYFSAQNRFSNATTDHRKKITASYLLVDCCLNAENRVKTSTHVARKKKGF